MERLSDRQLSLENLRPEHMKTAKRLRRVFNLAFETLERGQLPGVADLAAALAVERRLVRHDLDRLADFGAFDAVAVLDDRQDDALTLVPAIARELGASELLGNIEPELVRSLPARSLPRSASRGFLLRHGRIEPPAVDAKAAGTQRVFG